MKRDSGFGARGSGTARGERVLASEAVPESSRPHNALTVLTLGWIVPWFTQVLATTLTVTTVGCLVLITANRLRRRPAVRPDTLYAWSGQSLLVVNTRGECAEDQRLTGYYFRETRFLRTLQLRINGHAPWPCEASSIAPDTLLFTYVHPEITTPTGGGTGQGLQQVLGARAAVEQRPDVHLGAPLGLHHRHPDQ